MAVSSCRGPIGLRIEQALNGRTQAWLSAETGISRQTINGIVVHAKMPGADKALVLARALNVSVNWLIEGEPSAPQPAVTIRQRLRLLLSKLKRNG